MKRLTLVRHGKSSWGENLPDDKRPLLERGETDGELVATAFSSYLKQPIKVWTSPAVRALETAKIFKRILNIGAQDFQIVKALYTFNMNDLYKEIKNCDNTIDNLMIFGHNPATTNLVNLLGESYVTNVPTTGLTMFDFDTDSWEHIENGKTILSLFPKNLR